MQFLFPLPGNIDSNNKSSITNGICCSTNSKYAKPGRKNSNQSQSQEPDKKPLNNSEQFDGIDQIIAHANTATLKSKKSTAVTATASGGGGQCNKSNSNSSSKDRKKLHGSLPNHLDTDVDYEGSDDTNSSGKSKLSFFPLHLTLVGVYQLTIKAINKARICS